MFPLKTLDAIEGPEERRLLSGPEASPAFWNPLISRISLLAPVPPVSSEAQRDFYPMASKCCPVQYTALAGKGSRWRKMGKILPQPPSQELPMMVREVLSWWLAGGGRGSSFCAELGEGIHPGPMLLLTGLPLGSPATERLGFTRPLAFRDCGGHCCIPAPGLGQGASFWLYGCM